MTPKKPTTVALHLHNFPLDLAREAKGLAGNLGKTVAQIYADAMMAHVRSYTRANAPVKAIEDAVRADVVRMTSAAERTIPIPFDPPVTPEPTPEPTPVTPDPTVTAPQYPDAYTDILDALPLPETDSL